MKKGMGQRNGHGFLDKLFKVDEGRRNKLPVTDQGKK